MQTKNVWRKWRGVWLLAGICLLMLMPQTVVQAKSKNQGKAGKKITWSYQPSKKTLTLSGKGYVDIDKLFKENEDHEKVWLGKADAILPMFQKIIFAEGITEIDNSFFYLENVKSISLPKSFRKIRYCKDVISRMNALSKVNGSYDPWSSTFQTIRVAKQNKKFKVSGGALVSKDGKTLYVMPSGRSRTKYSVSGKVTKIAKYAFWGTDIKKITLGNRVTTIGECAFHHSTIKEVEFGKKVNKIGYGAFWGCNLTELKFPDSLSVIGAISFFGCPLTEVVIPQNVSRIRPEAFANNRKLQKVVIQGNTDVGQGVFFDTTRYYDGKMELVNQSVTVVLGKEMRASVDYLCRALGDRIIFQVDSENAKYYVKDKDLYTIRDDKTVYIYSEGVI